MKDIHSVLTMVILLLAGWIAAPAAAADQRLGKAEPKGKQVKAELQGEQASKPARRVARKKRLVYRPRNIGKPKIRTVGAGSRGTGEPISLSALTPEHTGLTSHAQPTLFWYLSSLTSHPLELIVSEEQASTPLLITNLEAPSTSGIQRVRLADFGVKLDAGLSYRWYVAIVPDTEHRSKDIIAGGGIERQQLNPTLHEQLQRTDMAMHHHLYAETGFWYDALTAISDLIDADPGDLHLRQQRAALLTQVGLPDIASEDLKSQ